MQLAVQDTQPAPSRDLAMNPAVVRAVVTAAFPVVSGLLRVPALATWHRPAVEPQEMDEEWQHPTIKHHQYYKYYKYKFITYL